MAKKVEKVEIEKKSAAQVCVAQGIFQGVDALRPPGSADEWLSLYAIAPWTYAGISAIANAIAALDIQLFKRKKGADPTNFEEVLDHPALDLLRKPNPDNTYYTLLEATMIHLETTGRAYWEVVKGSIGNVQQPQELYPLRPSRITPVPDKQGGIAKYTFQVRSGGKKVDYDPDELVCFQYFNPVNDFQGLAPIMAAVDPIRLEKQIVKWNTDFFRNGTALDGILHTEQALSPIDLKAIKEMWQDMVKGRGRTVPVFGKGLEYQPMGINPKELDFNVTSKSNVTQILATLGVPPVRVGILDQAKYDNYMLQEAAFYRNTILPKLKKLECSLNRHYLEQWGLNGEDADEEYFFKFKVAHLIAEDADRLTGRLIQQIGSGIRTPNEARKELGLEPSEEDGMDSFYMPTSLQPMGTPPVPVAKRDKLLSDALADVEKRVGALLKKVKSDIREEILEELAGK